MPSVVYVAFSQGGPEVLADRRSQVLNLIAAHAHRHKRTYLYGPNKRINQRRVANAMGIDPATLSRVASGDTSSVTTEFLDALQSWVGIHDDEDFVAALREAPTPWDGAFGRKYP